MGIVGSSVVAVTTVFGLLPAVAAASDNPRGATKFRDLPYADQTDASTATGGSDDPSSTCFSDPPNASLWYRFQPKVDAPFTIDTFGSDYDTVLAVYTGDPGQSARNLKQLVCNDDTFGLQSQVQFEGKRNQTYFVMVDTFSDTGAGNLVFNASSP